MFDRFRDGRHHVSERSAASRARLARLINQVAPPPGDPGPEDGRVRLAGRLVERWLPLGGGGGQEDASDDGEADGVEGAKPALTPRRRWLDRRMTALAAGAGLVAVMVSLLLVLGGKEAPEPTPALPAAVLEESPSSSPPSGSPTTAKGNDGGVIVVSVVGKVAKPGLVEVREGSRVADAVEAAGGAKRQADLASVNLARKVADGEQIAVGVPPAPDAGGEADGSGMGGKIDLNAATDEQLRELPGVGEVTAGRIIDWRAANGGFTTVEQLREVSGIGERRLADLRERVTVG